jgi:hypothetical protein
MNRLLRHPWPFGFVAAAILLPAGPIPAETCLSPFVKRLDRPEKYLYVFCLDAAAKNHDSMIVVDVDPDSKVRHGPLSARSRLVRQRNPSLRLHRRPHPHLGLLAVLESDLHH